MLHIGIGAAEIQPTEKAQVFGNACLLLRRLIPRRSAGDLEVV
jgi:hypothetical protein